MRAAQDIPSTITKAFTTALLLTGNAKSAEDVVIEALAATPDPCSAPDTLTIKIVTVSLNPQVEIDPSRNHAPSTAESILPAELRRVLVLSNEQRKCFTLRVLLGWNTEGAARFLQIGTDEVEHHVRGAILQITQSAGHGTSDLPGTHTMHGPQSSRRE
jgi:hypothetical protein